MRKKVYNAPFWIMLFITIYFIVFNYVNVRRHLILNNRNSSIAIFIFLLWSLLLLAETIIYYIIRRKIKHAIYAWLHVTFNAIAFILVQLILLAVLAKLKRTNMPYAEYIATLGKISQIHFFSFWTVFITGNAFFITTIVDIFRKNEEGITDNEQPPGILDGIVNEY